MLCEKIKSARLLKFDIYFCETFIFLKEHSLPFRIFYIFLKILY